MAGGKNSHISPVIELAKWRASDPITSGRRRTRLSPREARSTMPNTPTRSCATSSRPSSGPSCARSSGTWWSGRASRRPSSGCVGGAGAPAQQPVDTRGGSGDRRGSSPVVVRADRRVPRPTALPHSIDALAGIGGVCRSASACRGTGRHASRGFGWHRAGPYGARSTGLRWFHGPRDSSGSAEPQPKLGLGFASSGITRKARTGRARL
jgi:hypothetical protein